MNSGGLQQNFIWFLENKAKEAAKELNKRLCCKKCRFSTKDIKLFERHVTHHEEVTFSCTLCNHVSYSRVESQRHSVSHKGSYPYKCNWCSYGAVRRDYMVKHIQRIHGKTANGSYTTDCIPPTAKTEHLSQQQIINQYLDSSQTSSEPVQNISLVNHSAGNVISLIPSISQSRTSAPYLLVGPVEQTTSNQTHLICSTAAQSVTGTTCVLPVTKTTSHTVSKFPTHGINSPPNVQLNEVDYRLPGKTSSGKATSPSTIPRVHVSIPADRALQQKVLLQGQKTVVQSKAVTNSQVCISADRPVQQQKPLVQSQLGSATEKTVNQSKTFANSQVICLAANCDIQQKTLLQNHAGATTEKIVIQSKTAPNNVIDLEAGNSIHLKSLLNNPVDVFGQRAVEARNVPAQRPGNSGVIRNIPVAYAVQRSIPSGAHPSSPVERFGQSAPSITHGTHKSEKSNGRNTCPNIFVKRPLEKPAQSTRSSLQVELLSPLNQPIQHNKPLTVSCPKEITIPAGCLVELVEVKNINGARELELRVVPQQQSGPQLGSSKGTTVDSNRLSFKCKVATDDQERPSSQTGAIPEPQFKGSQQKGHSTEVTVDVKDEPDIIDQITGSSVTVAQTPGSSSEGFCGAQWSSDKPSESRKVVHQPSPGHRNTAKATGLNNPVRQAHFRGRAMPQSAINKKVAVEGFNNESSSSQTSLNKHEDVEPSYQGFPVISSVFSLCPSPEAALSIIPTKAGILGEHVVAARASPNSRLKGTNEKCANSTVCSTDLKTEEGTGLLTENLQKVKNKDEISEDIKLHDKIDKAEDISLSSPNGLKSMPGICGSSAHALQAATTDPPQEKNPLSKNVSTPSGSASESSLPTQKESHVSLNPTVALPRIPSLDFYSLLQSAKNVQENAVDEESITARPVLCCTSNQQNMQERSIKLILKRKRSEIENKDLGQDSQPYLESFHIHSPFKKQKKEKKREKTCKSSNVMSQLHQVLVNGQIRKLWLTPLKEDQLVKRPAPNQPMVVLNHPNPLFQMEKFGVQDYQLVDSAQSPRAQPEAPPDRPVNQCPSLKMKLKKVEGQTYQVTELVLKGVSESKIL